MPQPVVWFLSVFILSVSTTGIAHGLIDGEIPAFDTNPYSPGYSSHRQHVCDRYELYRNGDIELKDALAGLALQPVFIQGDDYVNSPDGGIAIELLDAVAERAFFTWRKSFGVTAAPHTYNMTSTEMLLWSVENYDISIDAWDHSVERMEFGVTFTEPWFDSSFILIDRRRNLRQSNSIDLFNWTKPFEPAVWGMIVFTIILSGLVYQVIEYLNGEREERSLYQWMSDNIYLSAINFSQNFEYAPSSLAGRIFGVSMTLWALVITATYTANLASLFVDSKLEPVLVDSMESAVVYGYRVCTVDNTNMDFYIRDTYPKALREARESHLAAFDALRNGECELLVAGFDEWHSVQLMEAFNPDCDLEWVGDIIKKSHAGFAVIADAGDKCSSLVRDVVNLHLVNLVEEGFLEELKRKYRALDDDGVCAYNDDDNFDGSNRQLLTPTNQEDEMPLGTSLSSEHRMLKGGGAKAAGGATANADTLTVEQMLGTFVVHWGAMAVALVVSLIATYAQKLGCFHKEGQIVEKVTNRTHGPIIGQPPPINTFVVRNYNGMDISHSSRNGRMQESSPVSSNVNLAEIMGRMNDMERALNAQSAQSTAMQKTLVAQNAMMHDMQQLLKAVYKEHDV
ncbi:receptor ionotropic, delta-2 [Seminavis robusta]|uniref:Receptor ionotropic, delta-2 n=1 Tax=Seminavis robusta TaxID=568900 RepID=A0A9N8HN14_9STRA|nr:receptor ionotropic, delta-2 [Seminavis robusta]|eukprot:Sro949_g223700.1 receptor ionotropic, delta-2 (625) ;mRNA; r:31102-32976